MTRTREQIGEARRRARKEYGELFDAVAALLFRHDPVGINFEVNSYEYEPEAETILPRLRSCQSESDALRVIHEEFVRWFDPKTAGTIEHYKTISAEIWELWLKQRHLIAGPLQLKGENDR